MTKKELIEKCAKIAEDHHGAVGDSIAAAIRALKDPPPTNPELSDLVGRITSENRHGEGEF